MLSSHQAPKTGVGSIVLKNNHEKITLSLVIVFNLILSKYAFSQPSNEALIRTLEIKEREAILTGDTTQLSI